MSSYSLWLTPSAAQAPALRAEIARLRGEVGGPAFEPHVTLLVAAPGTTDAAARAACAALAAARAPLHVAFTGVEAGADARHWRFRCVFARVRDDAAVHAVHAAAKAALPAAHPDEPYMPHLSLLYSEIDAAGRAAAAAGAARALAAAGAADGATLDAIELWFTPTADCAEWRLVERFPLDKNDAGAA